MSRDFWSADKKRNRGIDRSLRGELPASGADFARGGVLSPRSCGKRTHNRNGSFRERQAEMRSAFRWLLLWLASLQIAEQVPNFLFTEVFEQTAGHDR